MRTLRVLITACVASFSACARSAPPPPPPPAPAIEGLPFELTIQQRRTAVVRGTKGRLALSIDDITGDQTHVTLRADGKLALLDARSMRPRASAAFQLDGQDYVLRLDELVNNLIGEDFATFSFRVPEHATSTDGETIERLIASIETLEHVVFLRNGAEHTPAEAAQHLRAKLAAAGDSVRTPEQFIESVASRSSVSGAPYEIRFDDGRTTTVEQFLRAQR